MIELRGLIQESFHRDQQIVDLIPAGIDLDVENSSYTRVPEYLAVLRRIRSYPFNVQKSFFERLYTEIFLLGDHGGEIEGISSINIPGLAEILTTINMLPLRSRAHNKEELRVEAEVLLESLGYEIRDSFDVKLITDPVEMERAIQEQYNSKSLVCEVWYKGLGLLGVSDWLGTYLNNLKDPSYSLLPVTLAMSKEIFSQVKCTGLSGKCGLMIDPQVIFSTYFADFFAQVIAKEALCNTGKNPWRSLIRMSACDLLPIGYDGESFLMAQFKKRNWCSDDYENCSERSSD